MNWSRIIGNIGRTLIGAGTLILLFVVYQLWGTALQEARAQDALLDDFNAALEEQLGEAAAEVSLDEVALPDSLESTAVQQASVDIPTDAETAALVAQVADVAPGRMVIPAALGKVDPQLVLGAAVRGPSFAPPAGTWWR